ncbi:MAG: hypothetical protein J6A96_01550 [Clostridia bacterium]|nr:hypothetical protein [Clostridia bacterium]
MKKMKIPLLYALSFLCSVLPVLIYFLINHESYISTTPEKVKLLFGGVLAVAILITKTIGVLKINSGITLFALVFAFAYLLEGIINDLLIFSFLALVGEVLAFIVRLIIKSQREKDKLEKTEQAIEKVIAKTNGRV